MIGLLRRAILASVGTTLPMPGLGELHGLNCYETADRVDRDARLAPRVRPARTRSAQAHALFRSLMVTTRRYSAR